jgi:hypothetical protein
MLLEQVSRRTDLQTAQLLHKNTKMGKIQIRSSRTKTEFVDLLEHQRTHQMVKQDYWLVRTQET